MNERKKNSEPLLMCPDNPTMLWLFDVVYNRNQGMFKCPEPNRFLDNLYPFTSWICQYGSYTARKKRKYNLAV